MWNNWDEITLEWFSFLEWTILWSVLFVVTIFEIYYAKNLNPGFIYLKIAFAVITIFSSLLLILYIFKKCYVISKKLLPPGRSKLLWIITFIEAIALCAICVLVISMIAVTLKSV